MWLNKLDLTSGGSGCSCRVGLGQVVINAGLEHAAFRPTQSASCRNKQPSNACPAHTRPAASAAGDHLQYIWDEGMYAFNILRHCE